MMIPSHLQPQTVLAFFETLTTIPRGSGNCKAVSDYCVSVAKEHGLWVKQDGDYNVIIKKPATAGYEQKPAILLQGHLDMVCVKEADCNINFETDPIPLVLDGDFLRANGTSLGADNGIAIAYGLALAVADDIPHPPLELVFTVDEEIGLLGAASVDLSDVTATRMINLDSELDGEILVGCAGGATLAVTLPIQTEKMAGTSITLTVNGMLGGHSGGDIHLGRGNAIKLLARLLYRLGAWQPRLVAIHGGSRDNVIPSEATATIILSSEEAVTAVCAEVTAFAEAVKQELSHTDSGVTVTAQVGENTTEMVLTADSHRRLVGLCHTLPNGIQTMSGAMKGLVESSLNLGVLRLSDSEAVMSFSVRSAIGSLKEEILDRATDLAEQYGANTTVSGRYPAWEYREESPLRDTFCRIYKETTGKSLSIATIHAGLECGFFAGKIPDLDCISLGPDAYDIHTTKERLSISSTEEVWKLLLKTLAD